MEECDKTVEYISKHSGSSIMMNFIYQNGKNDFGVREGLRFEEDLNLSMILTVN